MARILHLPDMQSEINVTPLIDVLLVLLVVFFLINLLQMRLVQDVQVPPPVPATAELEPQIVLELLPGSGYAVNQQPVPAESLLAYLAQIYERRPSKLLFVKADTARRYQEVIDAMDLARAVGIQTIAFVPAALR
jgi:biopolymer transport protein TolR